MKGSNRQILEQLRIEAEKHLDHKESDAGVQLSDKQIKDLLHELQVQQIELEMQNDELKISNEEMEAQRIKFAGLYDLAPVGYFILDHTSIVEEVNTTGVKMLDTTKRTILKRRFQSFVVADNADLYYGFTQRMSTSSARQSCQLTMINPHGKTFYAQVEGTAVHSQLNSRVQYYLAVIDITERRSAELKEQETRERLEMALDASATGTWEIDLRTRKVNFDEFCGRIFGVQHEPITRLDAFFNTIHPADRRRADAGLNDAIKHSNDLDIEFRIIRPDNTVRFVGARGHIVTDDKDQNQCFVGLLTDITEKKQLALEALHLKNNQQKAIHEATLQAQENERRRISESLHDSVSQLLYGIKLKLEHNKDLKAAFGGMVKDLNGMLDQAIKETRNISFELAPSILKDFGLAATIGEMAKRLRTESLTIRTKTEVDGKLPLSIQTSLFRIVQELTNNSIKHAGATEIAIELVQKNKSVKLYVIDNGKGFLAHDNKAIVGTGLASIKNRLSLYNGKMKIESKALAGTKIAVVLKVNLKCI